jgi:hypothetical protein
MIKLSITSADNEWEDYIIGTSQQYEQWLEDSKHYRGPHTMRSIHTTLGTLYYVPCWQDRGTLYKVAGFDCKKIDFAVPQDWADCYMDRNNLYVWYYGEESIGGRPLSDREAWSRVDSKVMLRVRPGDFFREEAQ